MVSVQLEMDKCPFWPHQKTTHFGSKQKMVRIMLEEGLGIQRLEILCTFARHLSI